MNYNIEEIKRKAEKAKFAKFVKSLFIMKI